MAQAQTQFKYNVIFNSAEQGLRQPTEDSGLASEFVEKMDEKLRQFGYNGYNPDLHARLGRSKVKELNFIVKNTEFTIVIITPEFVGNDWEDFKKDSALYYLKQNGRRDKMLTIAVHTQDLPQDLQSGHSLFFPDRDSWEDETKWRRIVDIFRGEDNPVQEPPNQPIQEFGDNILRTDEQNIVARPASVASSLSAMSSSLSAMSLGSLQDDSVPELNNEGQNENVVNDNQNMNSANDFESAHSLPGDQLPQIQNLNINDGGLDTDGAPTNVSMADVPTGVIQPSRPEYGLRNEDNPGHGPGVVQPDVVADATPNIAVVRPLASNQHGRPDGDNNEEQNDVRPRPRFRQLSDDNVDLR